MIAMLDKLKEIYEAVSDGKETALTFTVDGEAYYLTRNETVCCLEQGE